MMYVSKETFIKEFAERTKANYQRLRTGPYEITQLINSMIGLLIIPEQRVYDKISDSLLDKQLLNKLKDSSCLKRYTYPKQLNLQQICRHLRNAIAHSHIDFKAIQPPILTDPITIESILFSDTDGTHYFEMQLSAALLEEFLFAFSDAISKT